MSRFLLRLESITLGVPPRIRAIKVLIGSLTARKTRKTISKFLGSFPILSLKKWDLGR
jgi:hypothetical protein